jgi:hypothetical protein
VLSTLPPNRIVTQILLDGQRLPKIEENHWLENMADTFNEVHIRTVDKSIWAATGLDIALSCIERVQQSLIRAAELFRDEDSAQANHFFVHCIDGLERFIEAIMITRCALSLDFSRIQIEGISLSQIEKDLSRILETIVSYQEKQDFIALADKVEYELLTNLHSWTSALRQLRIATHTDA